MYTIAYAHLHNRYDAEDAVSEAFIHIIKHIEKFKDPASNATLGLIYVITHRCAIKIFNKNKPIIDVLEEEIDYYAEHFEYNIEDIIMENEKKLRCIEVFGKLEKIYLDVLIMRFDYGFSFDKISKILGISSSNARMRYTRAIKVIKKRMENSFDTEKQDFES